jgi:hypothetical protein
MVWRAERQFSLQYFDDWLVGRTALGDGVGWPVGGCEWGSAPDDD